MSQNPLNPKFADGTISGTGGIVYDLVERIRTQLDPDAYGEVQELQLQGDAANAGVVYLGKISPVAGDVSSSNYGYSWAINSILANVFRSAATQISPVNTLRILSASNWVLHVQMNG